MAAALGPCEVWVYCGGDMLVCLVGRHEWGHLKLEVEEENDKQQQTNLNIRNLVTDRPGILAAWYGYDRDYGRV